MSALRTAEQTYRNWSNPILLELKAREHQLNPSARQALENILVERKLLNWPSPTGNKLGVAPDRR